MECTLVTDLCTTSGELEQREYAQAIESLQYPSNARNDQALTAGEVSGLRGLSGSLQVPRLCLEYRQKIRLHAAKGRAHRRDGQETLQVASPGSTDELSALGLPLSESTMRGNLCRRSAGTTPEKRKSGCLSHFPCRRRVPGGPRRSFILDFVAQRTLWSACTQPRARPRKKVSSSVSSSSSCSYKMLNCGTPPSRSHSCQLRDGVSAHLACHARTGPSGPWLSRFRFPRLAPTCAGFTLRPSWPTALAKSAVTAGVSHLLLGCALHGSCFFTCFSALRVGSHEEHNTVDHGSERPKISICPKCPVTFLQLKTSPTQQCFGPDTGHGRRVTPTNSEDTLIGEQ